MKTTVWAEARIHAFYRRPEVPEGQSHLRDWHRVEYRIRLGKQSTGGAEDEARLLQGELQIHLQNYYAGRKSELSRERIAGRLLTAFGASFVEVSEGGVGAVVEDAGEVSPETDLTLVREKIYTGTLAEGPNRGRRCVFVPGNVSPERVAAVLNLKVEWDGSLLCYYGAGNCPVFRDDTFAELLKSFKPENIVVEVNDLRSVTCALPIGVTTVSLHPADSPPAYLKRVRPEEGTITWRKGVEAYVTNTRDPYYHQEYDLE